MEDTDEDTPLMRQYRSIKEGCGDAVLFFRLGDFYEMFDDDAREVSRLLNLTLTHRGPRPMCGIPFHAAKVYIARLLRAGRKIAVCEQVGEVTGRGLTERKVVEVITPGTAVDGSYLDGGSNSFLACLRVSGGGAGFAFIDVTTADFMATSWPAREMAEAFPRELGRARPRELLLPESLRGDGAVQSALSSCGGISVSYFPDWEFDDGRAFRRLTEQFGTASLKPFALSEGSPEVAPAGFLLDYISRTAITSSPHVSGIRVYRDSQFLMMDDSSRRNLEVVANLRDGSARFSLLGVVGGARTAMGRRLVRKWLLYPLLDVAEIRARQEEVARFVADRRLLSSTRERLGGVLDVERLAGRIAMERAHAKDLQALRASLSAWADVGEALGSDVSGPREIALAIGRAILDDPSTSLTEGRLIAPGWSEELDRLRGLRDNAGRIMEEYAEEERRETGIASLKVRRTDQTGYFIEVPRGKTVRTFPGRFTVRRALANSDRFTTPRLQEIEAELNEASSRVVELERTLFLEFRLELAGSVPRLLAVAGEIALADCASTLADAAVERRWVRPEVDGSGALEIRAGRHPVVEAEIPQGEFVPNDALLSSDGDEPPRFALITGPNMAGKSTYLRQTALIVLMAQMGSFVPAESAHVGVVDRIFCRVGASDNLARGESTFLVEMTETAFILRGATERSLVIMDEVGRGTSTEDGLSIAWAVSEHLLNSVRCKTLFATHYHELTRMDHPSLRLLCMDVSDSGGSVVFLRRVKEGASENSYGIHVAALAGVPAPVISRAEEILSGLQSARETGAEVVIGTSRAEPEPERNTVLPGLFSDEELVIDEILSADVDGITPRQALAMVSRWKDALSGR